MKVSVPESLFNKVESLTNLFKKGPCDTGLPEN